MEELLTALGTSDINSIGTALRHVGSTPDFYLWLYVMFAISNAMLPTPNDRRGWPLVLVLFGGVLLFLVVIGVGHVLLRTFTGPVAHGVDLLSTAFLTVLIVEVPGMLLIVFLEEILERATKRKFQYAKESRSRSRQPGSSDPLPPDAPLPSIYNLNLPIPMPAEQRAPSRARPPVAASRRPSQPATTPADSPPRPVPASPTAPPERLPRSPSLATDATSPRQRADLPGTGAPAPGQERPPFARPAPDPARATADDRSNRPPAFPQRTPPDPSRPARPAEPGAPRVAGPPAQPQRPFDRPAQPTRPDLALPPGQSSPAPRRQPSADPDGVFDRLSAPGRSPGQIPPGQPAQPRDRMPGPAAAPVPFRRPSDRPVSPAQPVPPRRPAFPADEDEADENGELRYERFDDDAVQDNIYEDE